AVAELGAAGFVAGSPANDPYPIVFDFNDDCLTEEDEGLTFQGCMDHLGGSIEGQVSRLGDRLRGSLIYISAEGLDSQASTFTISATLDIDVTFDGETLGGSVDTTVT